MRQIHFPYAKSDTCERITSYLSLSLSIAQSAQSNMTYYNSIPYSTLLLVVVVLTTTTSFLDAFSVTRVMTTTTTRLTLSKTQSNRYNTIQHSMKESTNYPPDANADVDRARVCAENFGQCSVEEMEELRNSKWFCVCVCCSSKVVGR